MPIYNRHMDYIFVLAGLGLLFIGGEGLVRGSVAISARLGVSAILIGVVVVGFGTSAPELLVSLQATLTGQSDIAMGNVVGSNIANILLILGLAGVLYPIKCTDPAILRDSTAGIVSATILFAFTFIGIIPRLAGIAMLVLLCFYLFYSYKADKRNKKDVTVDVQETIHELEAEEFDTGLGLKISILLAIGGIIMLVIGADLLVRGATSIARGYGVSEAVIGLSLVALGTSLPEMATVIAASMKKQTDVVIGNVMGSNLFNILSILGITSIIKPVPVTGRLAEFDVLFALVLAIIVAVIILLFKRIGRVTGITFLSVYFVYMIWLFLSNGSV